MQEPDRPATPPRPPPPDKTTNANQTRTQIGRWIRAEAAEDRGGPQGVRRTTTFTARRREPTRPIRPAQNRYGQAAEARRISYGSRGCRFESCRARVWLRQNTGPNHQVRGLCAARTAPVMIKSSRQSGCDVPNSVPMACGYSVLGRLVAVVLGTEDQRIDRLGGRPLPGLQDVRVEVRSHADLQMTQRLHDQSQVRAGAGTTSPRPTGDSDHAGLPVRPGRVDRSEPGSGQRDERASG